MSAGALVPDGGPRNWPNDIGCTDSIQGELAPEAWFEAAALACHPGAIQVGPRLVKVIEPEKPLFVDIPNATPKSCFSAYVIVEQSALPLSVALLDDQNRLQKIGTLRSIRNAIPAAGPLCSLGGTFRKLKFAAEIGHKGTLTLAIFYAN